MATRWTSKHTGQKIDDTIDYVCNHNLLDNWYFGSLVDQRGGYVVPPGKPYLEGSTQVGTTDKYYTATPFSTWYNITVNGVVYNVDSSNVVRGYTGDWMYSFDRWRISPSSTVCISGGGLSILADFQQAISSTSLILGQKYTMSVLSTDGRLRQLTFTLQQDINVNHGFGFGYFVIFRDSDKYWFRLYGTNEATYLAIKLELGTTQTLAHWESDKWVLNEIPDYGEQLRRCQRYFMCYKAGTVLPCVAYSEQDGWYLDAALPITGMRTSPVHNIGDGLSCSVRNINSDSDFISKTISDWGHYSGVQILRIAGSENTSATWPYIIRMDADLTFSADL